MSQSNALKNLKARLRTRAANLLDPDWRTSEDGRQFPENGPWMTTAQYVAKYQVMNPYRKPAAFNCACFDCLPRGYSTEPLLVAETLQADGSWA